VYDITATYMEGTKCVIAEYGYAPGDKRCHKQIKSTLVVTKDGYPFYWKVLKGTTSDKTTVENTVTEMCELFGIENCTFVVDRGMASATGFDVKTVKKYVRRAATRPEVLNYSGRVGTTIQLRDTLHTLLIWHGASLADSAETARIHHPRSARC
jgi:transposase